MSKNTIARFTTKLTIEDKKNGLSAEAIYVKPKKKGMMGGLFSKKKKEDPKDKNKVEITIKQNGKVVAKGE